VFCGIGCGFLMTHIIIFTTDFGYSAMVGATLLSVIGALNLVGLLVTGHLSDRFNRGRMLAVTHVIRTIAFLIGLVFILAGGQPLWILYAMMVLFGFGWFTTAPLTTGLVADIFGNRSMGTIIGIVMSCHTIGTAIGAYAGGLSFDLTGSYRPVFIAQVALELAAAVMAYIVSRRAFRST
jgi:MFS family permease